MISNKTEFNEQSQPKNIYSRIEPDLSVFTVEELERALKAVDSF